MPAAARASPRSPVLAHGRGHCRAGAPV